MPRHHGLVRRPLRLLKSLRRELTGTLYYLLTLPLVGRTRRIGTLHALGLRLRHALMGHPPAMVEGLDTGFVIDPPLMRSYFETITCMEGDAFFAGRLKRETLHGEFDIEGMEHLETLKAAGSGVVMLSGHMGSLYTLCVALGDRGYRLFPIAGSVTRGAGEPLAKIWAKRINYRNTERLLPGEYVYVSSSGRIDRKLLPLLRRGEWIFACLDLPPGVSENTLEIPLFGQTARLPRTLIDRALAGGYRFVTAWATYRTDPASGQLRRHVEIEPPFEPGLSAGAVAMEYGARLERQIRARPAQWVGTAILPYYFPHLPATPLGR